MDLPVPDFLEPVAVLLVGGQLLFGLAYLRRVRGALARAPLTDGFFLLSWAVATAALLAPDLFRPAAAAVLAQSGIPAFLQEADARIEMVEALPQTIWDTLRGPFGWALEDQAPFEAISLRGGQALELRIVPAVEALLTLWVRAAAYVVAFGAMGIGIGVRRSASSGVAVRRLEARVAALEAAARAQNGALEPTPPPVDPAR